MLLRYGYIDKVLEVRMKQLILDLKLSKLRNINWKCCFMLIYLGLGFNTIFTYFSRHKKNKRISLKFFTEK